MKRLFVLVGGVAAWGLAFAAMLFVIGSERAVALQKSIGLGGASPWPVIVLSALVLLAGLSALDSLVARVGSRPAHRATSDPVSPITIAIICCLGLLTSLCVAMLGFDLSQANFR